MFPRQPTYIGFSEVIVLAFIWTSPVQAEENYVELWRHGRYTEALQAVEEASQSTTHLSLAQVRDQSELLFLTGRVDEAIEVRRAVTARQPLPSDLVRLAAQDRLQRRLALPLRYGTMVQDQRRFFHERILLPATTGLWVCFGHPEDTLSSFIPSTTSDKRPPINNF
jgi:hypothetical protein